VETAIGRTRLASGDRFMSLDFGTSLVPSGGIENPDFSVETQKKLNLRDPETKN
jgi:hypothetical protein